MKKLIKAIACSICRALSGEEKSTETVDYKPTFDVASPRDLVKQADIKFDAARELITISNVKGPLWLTTVQDTNSMDPTVDAAHTCILTENFNPADLEVGDVIVYQATVQMKILHRIFAIGRDGQGRLFKLKGDNNYYPDSFEVRDENITHLLLGVIY